MRAFNGLERDAGAEHRVTIAFKPGEGARYAEIVALFNVQVRLESAQNLCVLDRL